MENTTTTYESVWPQILNLNVIRPQNITTNSQKMQRAGKHVKPHNSEVISKIETARNSEEQTHPIFFTKIIVKGQRGKRETCSLKNLFLKFIYLFFLVISTPNRGLELAATRSRANSWFSLGSWSQGREMEARICSTLSSESACVPSLPISLTLLTPLRLFLSNKPTNQQINK